MKITDKIYIDLDKEPVHPDILKELTYSNPEYYSKKEMGISVWNIPKEIRTYEIKDRELRIMRGEALKVRPYIGSYQYNFEHQDHPVKLQYINEDFSLDDHQEGAVQAVKSKRQGIIHAVTSAGKSVIILKSIVELGQRALIVVHRKVLMKQLLEDIEKYIRDEKGNKIEVGIIGSGKDSIGDITIAIDKSLQKNLHKYSESFGTTFLDECHLAPAATMFTILNSINSRNRFGVTGTLRRKDQKDFLIYATFGEVIYKISREELEEEGRVVPVKIRIIETETRFDWDSVVLGLTEAGHKNPTQGARHLQEKTIMLDPERNNLILRTVAGMSGKIIVLSRYVEPCQTLQDRLEREFGIKAGIITGKDSKQAIESYEAMKHSDMKVIFATIGCVSTGVSISDLDHIVLISPLYTNELLLHQIRGRLMRKSDGKEFGTLHYLYDGYIFPEWKLKKFIRIMQK